MNLQQSTITKITATAVCTLFLMMFTMGRADAFQTNKTPYLSKEFSVSTPGQLNVQTSGGYIKVAGTDGNRVRVEMYVTKHGKDLSPSDTKLTKFDIEIRKDGNMIIASAKHKKGSWWKFWKNDGISISFVVHLPREMSTDLRTSGGHIIVTGLRGKQNIRTSGGYLKLDNLNGKVDARTSGGRIILSNLSGDIEARTSGGRIEISNVSGSLAARTSGGGIRAQNAEGKLHLRTSGGNIRLKNISGSVNARTSGGSILAQFIQINDNSRLRTSGGNINIAIPQNVGLNMDLSGSSVHSKLKDFSGSIKHNEVEGTVNGGGPELLAHTSGGSVNVSYR